ncbi:phosphatidylinositol polyphosphate 5-phosphatase type IV-like isoform X1 [Styela clava]
MEVEINSDEDEVVIPKSTSSQKLIVPNGIERCAKNNNDVEMSKNHRNKKTIIEDKERNNAVENLEDVYIIPPPSGNNVELELYNLDSKKLKISNSMLDQNNDLRINKFTAFRKNNSFPLSADSNGPFGQLSKSENFQIPLQNGVVKRLLPPIKKVANKKHRTLSDTDIISYDFESMPNKSLSTIDGSPAKSLSIEQTADEMAVKFQVGGDDDDDDELSDEETFDTSTSSDHESEQQSSTSSCSEDEEVEMNTLNISENLQTKLLKVLKLEEIRSKSPTASVASAPVFPNKKRLSLSDDEDNISVVSDSKVIRIRSGSSKNRGGVSRNLLTPEDRKSRKKSASSDIEFMAKQKDADLSPRSALGDEILDYDDEISETPSTRSTGILPALSSHGVRERNFLVGNLTKHGSLLGADELNRYFPDRMLRLFVGTWNMQRKGVPRNLNDFLLPQHEEYLQDMYVIGVQEATQDLKKWEIKLQETLGPNHVLAHAVSHGVLHMSIFIRRDLIWFCSPFEEDRVTTRMVSQIKTKGAVAISFQFFGTSMIFITSHFHSGETRVKERIEDYNRIKERIKLPRKLKWDTYKSSQDDVTTRFDCTFWFGDLNFRVSQPHEIMHQEVNNPDNYNFKEVLKGDQLIATKKRGKIFHEFTEAKIRFLPTYKFNPGTDKYDTSPKLRVPSYTDRILFKCKEHTVVNCGKYDSVTTLRKSDHRPVYGLFEVCLKPGRDSIPFGGGKFRNDVYEKAARLRAKQGNYQNSSAVCSIL